MFENQDVIEQLIEQSITFEYIKSFVHEYIPHYSDWRMFPYNGIVCPEVGECYYKLPSGEKWKIRPGETLIIPFNLNHEFEMTDGSVSHVHLHFKVFEHIDLLSLFSVPLILTGADSSKIYELIKKLNMTIEERKGDKINIKNIVKMKATVLEILTVILEASKVKNESLSFITNFQKIFPVIKYINEHMDEAITRKDMAKVLSLSQTRFHYVFTDIMKVSPVAYLKKLRLERAQQLLVSTDLPIAEIAERIGFRDIFHFSKQFKNAVGTSPSKYKERLNLSHFKVE